MPVIDSYSRDYLSLFKGREDYFACQGPDYYYPIKQPFSSYYLRQHLEGWATFGVYVLTSDSRCYFICIDIDIPKSELTSTDFTDRDKKYSHLKERLLRFQELFVKKYNMSENAILYEDTGGRGYHVWLFFSDGLDGEAAVAFHEIIKKQLPFDFEFFPKQSRIGERRKFGNLVKLPLGIHQKYSSRSVFFQLVHEEPQYLDSVVDNMKHLRQIAKLSSKELNIIIKEHSDINGAAGINKVYPDDLRHEQRVLYRQDFQFLFDHCSALRNLKIKAEKGLQFSRPEVFHLANLLLSVENSHDLILQLIRDSFGINFSADITQKEIAGIMPLYPSSCATLIRDGICDDYCSDEIRRRDLDPLLPNTNPSSLWLTRIPKTKTTVTQAINEIADAENVVRAYWRLKKYHRDEDVGFFDQFDFEHFEANLDVYSKYIGQSLRNHERIPLIGYLTINIPKKIDENNQMKYRPMAYSSVFDQIIIQAIFNIVGPIMEVEFQEYSYGYRLNVGDTTSDNIFNDWREYYPRFRSKALSNLRKPEIGYYICCDIKGFYDNVVHKILIEQIRGIVSDPYIFEIIQNFIKLYSFDEIGSTGLPQGPAYSRVLANLYLNDFDKEMAKSSSGYLRYVDDLFLFFETKEEAEAGLNKVVEALGELGLHLSSDESKKPEILNATNEERIVATLDSLRYGIFEELKFVDHLDERKINDLYDAIGRQHFVPANMSEFLEVNNALPAILHQITQNRKYYHAIKKKIPRIVEHLVDQRLFYPKRLKYVTYRLIGLMDEGGKAISDLYSKLENSHKIYFLLNLYIEYSNHGTHERSLKNIIDQGLINEDPFVKGLSIAIQHKLGGSLALVTEDEVSFQNVLSCPNYFLRMKLFHSINYFELNVAQKEVVRRTILPDSRFLEKKYLLENTIPVSIDRTDTVFIDNLLKNNTHLLFTECATLFSRLKDDNSLFRVLQAFFNRLVNHKDVIIYYLTSLILEEYKNARMSELKNQEGLYYEISDTEIRRELTGVISTLQRHASRRNLDSARKEVLVGDSYNGCFYFRHETDEINNHNFIEYIPINKPKAYEFNNISKLGNDISDLVNKKVLPDLTFEIDSTRSEALIKYRVPEGYKPLAERVFSTTNADIKCVFDLMEDLYKKAHYFYKQFSMLPLIKADNLLLSVDEKTLLFRKLGTMFCPVHIISGESIRNGEGAEAEIPKMISMLLKDLIFRNESKEIARFLKQGTPKVGINLFLAHFIQRMSSKELEIRYSYERVSYLTQRLKRMRDGSDYDVSVFYFSERLKERLYENNRGTINWAGICNTLDDFYRELAVIYGIANFADIKFRNKTLFSFSLPRNLHYLSKILLNICLNIGTILSERATRDSMANVLELMNYFAIFCIETLSFLKVGILSNQTRGNYPKISNQFILSACGYSLPYDITDVEPIQGLMEKDRGGQNVFDFSVNFTLKQISFLYLIKTFPFETNGGNIVLSRETNGIEEGDFRQLSFNMLKRLPEIENRIMDLTHNVMKALKSNTNYEIPEQMLNLKDDILSYLKNISSMRNRMKFKRIFGKRTKIDRFPPEICCRPLIGIGKCYITNQSSLFKMPLSTLYPSSKSRCSFDIVNNQIVNLIIPNEQINKLIGKLKGIGFQLFKYLYSDKAKLLWDAGTFIVLFVVTALLYNHIKVLEASKNLQVPSSAGWWMALAGLFAFGACFFIGKILLDFKYWSKKYSNVIDYWKKDA